MLTWREDTEFDGRQECAQLLIPKKRPRFYTGVEDCCKIVEGTIQVDPQLLF